mgnify:CR=1 FL=1
MLPALLVNVTVWSTQTHPHTRAHSVSALLDGCRYQEGGSSYVGSIDTERVGVGDELATGREVRGTRGRLERDSEATSEVQASSTTVQRDGLRVDQQLELVEQVESVCRQGGT